MQNTVRPLQNRVGHVGVGNGAVDETHALVAYDVHQILKTTRVGERIQQNQLVVAKLVELRQGHLAHARPDETRGAGND